MPVSRNRKVSMESLKSEEEKKLLEFDQLKKAAEENVEVYMEHQIVDENEFTDKNDQNIAPPKMNTLVGFLRISNFASATTVVFIMILTLMNEVSTQF